MQHGTGLGDGVAASGLRLRPRARPLGTGQATVDDRLSGRLDLTPQERLVAMLGELGGAG